MNSEKNSTLDLMLSSLADSLIPRGTVESREARANHLDEMMIESTRKTLERKGLLKTDE